MPLTFHASCLVLAATLLGCGGVGEYRQTGSTYAARGPGCNYRVIRSGVAEGPYEEVGVIDIDAFSMKQLPSDEAEFRKVVGPMVCAAGGQAVIPSLDIYGRWVIGTIIRLHPAECLSCKEDEKPKDGEV